LKIFGDGPLRELLQQQISDLKLTSSCLLEYPTEYIAEKYMESSIFVLSSRFEGFGLVIIEAMSCGLSVVSFDCPCGPKDIITNRKDGILVKTGDIEELAVQISYLIDNEKERKQLGKQALISVERYEIENIAILWKELFENLLLDRK
jgi:glycosyltransferase involved in cell wall biosynthesis